MAYQVLVGLGSNLRNRRYCLNRATDSIHADCGKVIAVSSCYESEAVGGVADRRFLNAVLLCQTDWPPQDFFARTLAIERQLDRVRNVRWENRTIDLDILLWREKGGDTKIVNLPYLQIPHPMMLLRDFTMLPACEIASTWRHPLTGDHLATELKKTTLHSIVRRLN